MFGQNDGATASVFTVSNIFEEVDNELRRRGEIYSITIDGCIGADAPEVAEES